MPAFVANDRARRSVAGDLVGLHRRALVGRPAGCAAQSANRAMRQTSQSEAYSIRHALVELRLRHIEQGPLTRKVLALHGLHRTHIPSPALEAAPVPLVYGDVCPIPDRGVLNRDEVPRFNLPDRRGGAIMSGVEHCRLSFPAKAPWKFVKNWKVHEALTDSDVIQFQLPLSGIAATLIARLQCANLANGALRTAIKEHLFASTADVAEQSFAEICVEAIAGSIHYEISSKPKILAANALVGGYG